MWWKLRLNINRRPRNILRIRWPRTISYGELWTKTGEGEIGQEESRRKLGWLRHTLTENDAHICKVLRWNLQGERKVERLRESAEGERGGMGYTVKH